MRSASAITTLALLLLGGGCSNSGDDCRCAAPDTLAVDVDGTDYADARAEIGVDPDGTAHFEVSARGSDSVDARYEYLPERTVRSDRADGWIQITPDPALAWADWVGNDRGEIAIVGPGARPSPRILPIRDFAISPARGGADMQVELVAPTSDASEAETVVLRATGLVNRTCRSAEGEGGPWYVDETYEGNPACRDRLGDPPAQ